MERKVTKELLDKLNEVVEEHFKEYGFKILKDTSYLSEEAVLCDEISLAYGFSLKKLDDPTPVPFWVKCY